MPTIQNLISNRSILQTRGDDGAMGDSALDYMIIVLALVFAMLLLVSVLVVVRRRRQQQQQQQQVLPTFNENRGFNEHNHKNLTIQTTQNGRSSILVINKDGQPMLQNPTSPPTSPDNVPEIRITFPDEQGDDGEKKNGRVLVVRVGDGGAVGLEPVNEEQLPAYEKESKTDFHSIDMDHIGGLKEKEYR